MHDDDRADEPYARGQARPDGQPEGEGGSEGGAERSGDSGAPVSEDAAWREIVANFGERAVLDDGLDEVADSSFEQTSPDAFVVHFGDGVGDDGEPVYLEDLDRYIPPPPPPLPKTTPARFLAWLGVLGTPVLAVLLVTIHTVTGFSFPSWLIAFLVLAFLGGFGFLLVTMTREPGDPTDDGARI